MTEQAVEKFGRDRLWADLVDRFFSDLPRWPALGSLWGSQWDEASGLIKVEEEVADGEFVIRAEMPGIDPDRDVQIHVRDHTLEVRAERRMEDKTDEEGRYRSEFRYGSFMRKIPLPPDADDSSVRATYENGILEVRMPVDKKRSEATKIEVTKGSTS